MARDLLTDMQVKALGKPGRYSDGGGLYIQVTPTGTKSWLFRYRVDGAERLMGLGAYPDVTLRAARVKADACREQRGAGLDPKAVREAETEQRRLDAARAVTFQDCAERFVASHEEGWKNPKHRQQWRNTLATYVYPAMGKLPVSAIDVQLVIKVLEPIWAAKPETAKRVRGRIETVLNWAAARGYRSGPNPAIWRGNIQYALPSPAKIRTVEHHAALPYEAVGDFVKELGERTATSARAFEFLILTAARTSEVLGARWAEIDEAAGVWTIPAERMKAGREHRVPVSNEALDVLARVKPLRTDAGYVFPNANSNGPLSNMALLTLLKRMGRSDITAHGFRSTFRDWAAECTGFPGEVAEAALAHAVGDKVEAAYRRGDLFEKRRQLMSAWARHCATTPEMKGVNNVTQFRGAAA
jgi:integrase